MSNTKLVPFHGVSHSQQYIDQYNGRTSFSKQYLEQGETHFGSRSDRFFDRGDFRGEREHGGFFGALEGLCGGNGGYGYRSNTHISLSFSDGGCMSGHYAGPNSRRVYRGGATEALNETDSKDTAKLRGYIVKYSNSPREYDRKFAAMCEDALDLEGSDRHIAMRRINDIVNSKVGGLGPIGAHFDSERVDANLAITEGALRRQKLAGQKATESTLPKGEDGNVLVKKTEAVGKDIKNYEQALLDGDKANDRYALSEIGKNLNSRGIKVNAEGLLDDKNNGKFVTSSAGAQLVLVMQGLDKLKDGQSVGEDFAKDLQTQFAAARQLASKDDTARDVDIKKAKALMANLKTEGGVPPSEVVRTEAAGKVALN